MTGLSVTTEVISGLSLGYAIASGSTESHTLRTAWYCLIILIGYLCFNIDGVLLSFVICLCC